MSVLPPHTSTLSIAKESLAMSEKTGDRMFQRMAIAFMALTGIGTLLHAVHEIYRDMQPRREKARTPASRGFMPAVDAEDASRPPSLDDITEESHIHRARVSPRPAAGETLWADAVRHADHARHR